MPIPDDQRLSLLRQYGTFTQAYSATFQPALSHFGDARGFQAYRMVGRTALALADPVTAPENRGELIARFVAQFKDVCFLQASRPTAEVLSSLGFMINEMGTETRIDLGAHGFKGRKQRTFRRAANRTRSSGYVTRECATAEIGEATIKLISDRWRRTRPIRHREIAFLTRPIVCGDEVDVRKFYSFDCTGKLVAFGFFDPVYDDDRVVGYLDAFRRRLPEADPLVNYAITRHAIETFQGEGRQWLFLGLSPFAQIEDKEFHKNWLVRRAFRFAYENRLYNRLVYSFRGLAEHKREYGGVTEQTYFAFNTPPALPRLFKALRACEIV
jgi:lysylphosphatidylglycerol synthetase-like protein (DUF2156 family)